MPIATNASATTIALVSDDAPANNTIGSAPTNTPATGQQRPQPDPHAERGRAGHAGRARDHVREHALDDRLEHLDPRVVEPAPRAAHDARARRASRRLGSRICAQPAAEDPRPVEQEEDREDEPGDERDAARRRRLERLRGRSARESLRDVVDEVLHAPPEVDLCAAASEFFSSCAARRGAACWNRGRSPTSRRSRAGSSTKPIALSPMITSSNTTSPRGSQREPNSHRRIHEHRDRAGDEHPRDDPLGVARDLEHQDREREQRHDRERGPHRDRARRRHDSPRTDDPFTGDPPDASVIARTITT